MPQRYLPVILALIAMCLTSPALGVGLQFDDLLHQQFLLSHPSPVTTAMNLFLFLTPEQTPALIEQGQLPWWTHPEAKLAFWRPLSALTHWLDYKLWPHSPPLMHAHSLAWFGLLIIITTRLYQQLSNQPSAVSYQPSAIAAILYALDSGHGSAVGWLANRNILIAGCYGFAALLTYHLYRQDSWRLGAWLTPLFLLTSLLSAESAIAVMGYLLAYSLILDHRPRPMLTLTPSFSVILMWQVIYRYLGYGTQGMAYADPFHAPLFYLSSWLENAPILLAAQFIFPFPELYNITYSFIVIFIWLTAVIISSLILTWLWQPTPLTRFFMLGLLLALFPATVIFPANRLLFFVSFGAMGLLAEKSITVNYRRGRACPCPISGRPQGYAPTNPYKSPVASMLILLHLILAPILLPFQSYSLVIIGQGAPPQLPYTAKTVIIVSAPSIFYTNYQLTTTHARLRVLATTTYPVTITRLDEQTLSITPDGGYLLGLESLFRGLNHPFHLHEVISLSDLTITITALTPHGRPATAQFRFHQPLTAPTFSWFYWQNGTLQPFPMPAIGQTIKLTLFTL